MAGDTADRPLDISDNEESSDGESTNQETVTSNTTPKETSLLLKEPPVQKLQPQHQATVKDEQQEQENLRDSNISEQDDFIEYDQFSTDIDYISDNYEDTRIKPPSKLPSPPPPPIAKRLISKAPVTGIPKDTSPTYSPQDPVLSLRG